MCVDISIIIPMYKGEKYLDKILCQISASEQLYSGNIELILVNDDPDTKIKVERKNLHYDVIILETTENTGMQSARLRGLSVARGSYIHFLDQDDDIFPEYYDSQMKCIGNSDAVYCRCYNGNRQTYNYDRIFETAFDREYILSVCPVVSPGQVLIKKNAIPKYWKENVLVNIASDDYLLWLCMYANGCKFVYNQKLIFRHVRNGSNFSSDILKNKKSDEEMVNMVIKSGLFSEEDCQKLRMLPDLQLKRRYNPQRKNQIVLNVLAELLNYHENENSLEIYLKDKGIHQVAIYGAAVMGERIKGLLKGTQINVKYFIDKNAPFIEEDIPVLKFEECDMNVDAIIISLIEGEEIVSNKLREVTNLEIFTIREIVRDIADGK